MAVRRSYNLYFVECDECGDVCDADGDNYQEAVDAFKMEGGRIFRDEDGDWRHNCSACRTQ